MAKSIGGLVFDITASTEKFQAQMRRVEQTNERIANQEVANARETAAEEERLQKIRDQIAAKRERSDELEAEAARASAGRAKKIRDQLRKIGESIAALETKEKNLAAEQKRNDTQRLGRMTKLRNELAKQTAEYNKMSGVVGRVKNAFAGLGGTLLAGVSVVGIKSFIDKLDDLGKRARDVGLTASQLQELGHQARLAGIATGTLDTSIKSFNRNISLAAMDTGEARKALDSMGISIKDTNGATKSQSALLKEVATYFANNAGEAENAGRATRLFGESGAEMLRIFEAGEDVVNRVFNAEGFDKASAAAERLNDSLENVKNTAMRAGAFIVNGWSDLIDYGTDVFNGKKLGATMYEREQKKANDAQRKKNAQERAAQRKAVADYQTAMDDFAKIESRSLSTRERYRELTRQIDAITQRETNSVAEAAKKQSDINKLLKERLPLKQQLDAQNESRREFELQTQISVLRAQGRTAEAEQLEFAKQRNELMRKYGYSIEEATRAQQTLNELNKPAGGAGDGKNLDDMQKKAQSILERGKGGTIGKKTLEDAQAAAEGRIPEGGFKTAMFKDYNPAKTKFKKINVDAKTAKQNLDNDAKDLERQNVEKLGNIEVTLSNMNNTITDIKNSVDAVATN